MVEGGGRSAIGAEREARGGRREAGIDQRQADSRPERREEKRRGERLDRAEFLSEPLAARSSPESGGRTAHMDQAGWPRVCSAWAPDGARAGWTGVRRDALPSFGAACPTGDRATDLP